MWNTCSLFSWSLEVFISCWHTEGLWWHMLCRFGLLCAVNVQYILEALQMLNLSQYIYFVQGESIRKLHDFELIYAKKLLRIILIARVKSLHVKEKQSMGHHRFSLLSSPSSSLRKNLSSSLSSLATRYNILNSFLSELSGEQHLLLTCQIHFPGG